MAAGGAEAQCTERGSRWTTAFVYTEGAWGRRPLRTPPPHPGPGARRVGTTSPPRGRAARPLHLAGRALGVRRHAQSVQLTERCLYRPLRPPLAPCCRLRGAACKVSTAATAEFLGSPTHAHVQHDTCTRKSDGRQLSTRAAKCRPATCECQRQQCMLPWQQPCVCVCVCVCARASDGRAARRRDGDDWCK